MEYHLAGEGTATDSDGVLWEASSSPDGRWAILTRDADDDNRHGGHRTSGPGLIDGAETRCEGRLLWPNDAKVANNGTFLIADWLFTDDLRCRVRIFDRSGSPIVDEMFEANVQATSLSDDGRYAAVHLASNPDRPDFDELVTIWNLDSPERLWSKPLEGGRADAVVLDPSAAVLRAKSSRIGWVDYDLATGATDVGAIRETVMREGGGFEALDLIQDEVSSGPVKSRASADIDQSL